ncbi:MAG: hypothetical protein NW217_09080 [Hyphomicrobiaceae bacterium]|nr:hypothetical protein [Hyphomicrobiaceae bacterium]
MLTWIVIALLTGVTIFAAARWLAPAGQTGRIRFASVPDAPVPFGYGMSWLAIRTDDTMGVASVIGLSEVEDANWNSGIGTVYHDEHGAARLFISPPVDGWTLVVGLALPHPVGPQFVDKLTPLLLRLGGTYNEVQYFFTYPTVDFFAWARVTNGKLVRAFALGDEGVIWNKGKPTKEERALGLRLFELRGVRGRKGDTGAEMVLYPTEDHVLLIARAWGLDPSSLGAQPVARTCGFVSFAPVGWRPERASRRAA